MIIIIGKGTELYNVLTCVEGVFMRGTGGNSVGIVCAAVLFMVLAVQAQVPGAPVLSTPTNGATNQSTSVTLSWTTASGASSYTVQLSQTSNFSTFVVNQGSISSGPQVISGLTQNTLYYWRVNAEGTGGTGIWSSVWSFTTFSLPVSPTLISPSNGEMNLPTTVTLNWTTSRGAETYGVYIGYFDSVVGISGTSASFSGLANNSEYTWYVRATNAFGTVTSVEEIFYVGPLTASPALALPSNGAINQGTSLTLSWNPVSTASSYSFQVSTVSSFSTTIVNQTGMSSTNAAMKGLSNSTNYYWRVNAAGPYGISGWSGTFSFTTILLAPATPVLIYPSNNSTDVNFMPVFTWQPSNTSTYTLQLSSASNFSTTIVSQSGLSSEDITGATLSYNSTYFWRMTATNSLGTSPWSSVWTFTVSAPPPTAAPVLLSPGNGVTVLPSATFSWGLVAGATQYLLEIFYMDGARSFPYYDTTLATTHWSDSSLMYQGSYSWQVIAGDGSGFASEEAASIKWYFAISYVPTLPFASSLPLRPVSYQNGFLLYTLPAASPVDISLYTLLGRKIALLNRLQSPGNYSLSLKNRNLTPGAYFLHFKAGNIERRMKVILNRQ